MKIEKCNNTDYKLYIFLDISLDKCLSYIREKVTKMQDSLQINGFYKLDVIWKKFGIFIDMRKMNDSFYNDTLDLKIIINRDKKLYFRTRDYFIIDKFNDVKYKDGNFYCLVDDDFDIRIENMEFGSFVFGKDIDMIISSSCLL